jgi:predicted DNA-binding transcriptional regulator AlpA
MNKHDLPSEGFVRLPAVLNTLGIGRSSLWAGVKTGRYPKPVKLGPRTTVWRVEEVRRFIGEVGNASKADA